jgi:methyl-accepting chemotaxis protein
MIKKLNSTFYDILRQIRHFTTNTTNTTNTTFYDILRQIRHFTTNTTNTTFYDILRQIRQMIRQIRQIRQMIRQIRQIRQMIRQMIRQIIRQIRQIIRQIRHYSTTNKTSKGESSMVCDCNVLLLGDVRLRKLIVMVDTAVLQIEIRST